MSKILFFSDLHVHMHKNQISRLYDCLKVLEWVFQIAIKKNIKSIVFAGDLFQDKQRIHTISYEKTFSIIRQYCENSDLKLYLLVGNHDMWYKDKWDISSIGPLNAINNVQVIAEPCSIQIEGHYIDFLPYTKNPLKDIKTHFSHKKNQILVSHCSVDGALLNSAYNTKAEISVEFEGDMVKVDKESFSGWRKVFLGHYHCSQELNDVVEYIGSPLELNFSEAFQQKHIIIFDLKTFNSEYIINDFSPKHLIIKESDVDKYDIEGNFVQVILDDITTTDLISIKKIIKNTNPATLEFKENPKKRENELSEEDKSKIKSKVNLSDGNVLASWINARKDHIDSNKMDSNKLLTIVDEIIRKTK